MSISAEKVRAVVIRVDGEAYFEMIERGNLAAFQAIVGGFIETFPVPPADVQADSTEVATMIINEEGKIHGLPMNPVATELASAWLRPGDYIVGPAIVFGSVVNGDETDVPKVVIDRIGDISREYKAAARS